ncbi:tyrosine-type recombinase/integrase [Actinomadura keratinilytica]|uniref:tyrosine-type recombinase/integrase n=1 Tax=Actinomadura keratinilytica TaxID=547461 RepID=UPI003CD06AD1
MLAVGAAAGLPGLRPHRLRHAYSTRLRRGGAAPARIEALLGHASIATSARVSPGRGRRARRGRQERLRHLAASHRKERCPRSGHVDVRRSRRGLGWLDAACREAVRI